VSRHAIAEAIRCAADGLDGVDRTKERFDAVDRELEKIERKADRSPGCPSWPP
jgi:hypothetical protein